MATYVMTTNINTITATATVPAGSETSFQIQVVNQFDDEAEGTYTGGSDIYGATVVVARIGSSNPSVINTLLIE